MSRLGELAKAFTDAAYAYVDASEEGRMGLVMACDTMDELDVIAGTQIEVDKNEPRVPGALIKTISPERYLRLAELFSVIAERGEINDLFRTFVPTEARTEASCFVLTKHAPAFAKLCA